MVWNGFIKKVGKGFNRKVGQWFGTVYTPMDCTRGDRAGITSYLFSNQRKILVGIAFPKAIYPPKDGKEDKHKTEGVVGQGTRAARTRHQHTSIGGGEQEQGYQWGPKPSATATAFLAYLPRQSCTRVYRVESHGSGGWWNGEGKDHIPRRGYSPVDWHRSHRSTSPCAPIETVADVWLVWWRWTKPWCC